MNKRIKELDAQAVEYAVGVCDANGLCHYQEYLQVVKEKFAELIIKECASLTLDHKSDDYYNGWLDYRDEIKKHFGVEE